MKILHLITALFAGLMTTGCATARDVEAQSVVAYEPMAIFAPIAGKTWRGEGTSPDGKLVADVVRFEYIIGGRALQATHRLENSNYGGRTIFFYDEAAEKYIYHYFTTAGFHTTGEVTPTENGFDSVETVQGHATVAEVRASTVFGHGAFHVSSSHVNKDGIASEGDDFDYVLFFDEADALFGK